MVPHRALRLDRARCGRGVEDQPRADRHDQVEAVGARLGHLHHPHVPQGNLGFFTLGWYPDFVDPDNFLAPWLVDSTQSLGTFWDKAPDFAQYQKLIKEARASTKQDVRATYYEQVQQLSATDVPFIPLWQNFGQLIAFTKPNVTGMVTESGRQLAGLDRLEVDGIATS